jgi:hypothetical protein
MYRRYKNEPINAVFYIIVVYFENHTEFLNSVWTACRVIPFKADGPVIHCALKV